VGGGADFPVLGGSVFFVYIHIVRALAVRFSAVRSCGDVWAKEEAFEVWGCHQEVFAAQAFQCFKGSW
jgi:hypothetical protein